MDRSARERTARVVLAEPVGILRASLHVLLDAEDDLEVMGAAATVDEAIEIVGTGGGPFSVALISLDFDGDHDAFWLMRSIRDRWPNVSIVATGTDLDRGAISQALFFGADGFIHKNTTPERFIEATRRAALGELVLEGLPRDALGVIVDGMESQRTPTPLLTSREQMVLTAAADGITAREIGRRLGVTERTVTTHLNHIYRKLGANGRVSALAIARRLGVLGPPERDVSAAVGAR